MMTEVSLELPANCSLALRQEANEENWTPTKSGICGCGGAHDFGSNPDPGAVGGRSLGVRVLSGAGLCHVPACDRPSPQDHNPDGVGVFACLSRSDCCSGLEL